MKGGYKIIDFKNVSLSGTSVTMTDVLVDLLNNYDKVVLLSHVVLLGSAKDDCFSTVLSDGAGGVKLNCYDGYISINSSGAVTYTVASASDLQNGLADTNNMIAPEWSATATYTKNSIVRDGGQLYKAKSDVPTGTVTSNTTYWRVTTEANENKSSANKFDLIIGLMNNIPRNDNLDANDITTTSLLYSGDSNTNLPYSKCFLLTLRSLSSYDTIQFATTVIQANRGKIFERYINANGGSWSEWKQINTIPE